MANLFAIRDGGNRFGGSVNEMQWQGKHVLIIGAARQGIALATYLSLHGVQVTLSDLRSAESFAEEQKTLSQLKVQWVFGNPEISESVTITFIYSAPADL